MGEKILHFLSIVEHFVIDISMIEFIPIHPMQSIYILIEWYWHLSVICFLFVTLPADTKNRSKKCTILFFSELQKSYSNWTPLTIRCQISPTYIYAWIFVPLNSAPILLFFPFCLCKAKKELSQVANIVFYSMAELL